MEKYIFVFAWNPLLSLAEAVSYFRTRNIKFKLEEYISNTAIFSFEKSINQSEVISWLGGTLKIGELILTAKQADLVEELDKITAYSDADKFKYGISMFGAHGDVAVFELLRQFFKKRFKEERTKAQYKGFSAARKKLQHALAEQQKLDLEFLAVLDGEDVHFGKVLAASELDERRKRDKKRPVQRPSLSISPRLSEILINLSGAQKGQHLLDPFCGIGTILSEALVKRINITGVDIDRNVVSGAKGNLKWLVKQYNLSPKLIKQLVQGDTKQLGKLVAENSIDAVATEPDLGPVLRKLPMIREAQRTISYVEDLYLKTLKEVKKALRCGGKIAITAPRIKAQGGKLSIDMKKIARRAGLVVVHPLEGVLEAKMPFVDARRRHKVEREIWILEKLLQPRTSSGNKTR